MGASELLTEAEMRAERAIAFLRFAYLFVAAVVIFATVQSGASSALRTQFPIIMASYVAYFVVGLFSLLAARPGRFQIWMPWAFNTCDLAIWFAVLATAVSNLGLPWYGIVVIPVIWYAPMLLSLAALRYNPWLQAYTTVFVTIALVVAAIIAQSGSANAIRTSPELNFLLEIPSHIGRGVMFLLAALALIVVAVRARRLLNRAITETVQRANLTRYLPPQLAERMAETGVEEMRMGRQQDAAVLFVDIRDFTARAERMEPEVLSHFLAEFRRVVTHAVEERGGVVDKFVGDSAMVVFGVPEPDSHDAANALDGARAILDAVVSWNAEREATGDDAVRIGVGLHWGQVFCGAVGDASRLEFTVLGDTVNVAARLEEATKRAELPLIVSDALLSAAGVDPDTRDDWIELPDTTIRGRYGNVRHYGNS